MVFYTQAAVMVFAAVPGLWFRVQRGAGSDKAATGEAPQSFARRFMALISTTEHVAFYCALLLTGTAMGVITNFLFLFLRTLNGSELLMGLSLTVTCAAEVPLFIASGWLIRRIGAHGVIVIACVCYGARFLGYSLLTDPWWVLAIEPLHGVTFACMWAASTYVAKEMAPPGLEATSQGLANGIFWGLGGALGSLLGGLLVNAYGSRTTFVIFAVATTLGGLGYLLLHVRLRRLGSGRGRYRRLSHIAMSELASA